MVLMACLEIDPERRVVIVRSEDGKEIRELNLEDLAEIVEFGYATPWNITKDSLEKVALVLEDLAYLAQSREELPEKEVLIDMLKKRKY
ncbi:hypothetical protein J2747_001958 [Thermococcus stetteri]|nr:hypothetical protein [Thermococcus stetteri]